MNRLLLLLIFAAQACRTGRDFSDAREPRYAAQPPVSIAKASDTVRIVSFNIAFAREIDRAIGSIALWTNSVSQTNRNRSIAMTD